MVKYGEQEGGWCTLEVRFWRGDLEGNLEMLALCS